MVRTWNAKGRGKVDNKTVISSEYFIENSCMSCGWSGPYHTYKDYVVDFQTYKEKWIELYSPSKNWNNQGVHHLFESVKKGDFIWTRLNGVYYLAEVPDDPINLFYIDDSKEANEYDCVVQLKNIQWIKCGTEESVLGSVSTFTSNRNSLVRVDNNESQYQGYTSTSIFSNKILHPNSKLRIQDRNMILNQVGPSGFEDIVALWLYDKYNYVVIPSTNKKSTQTYEFVLIDGTKVNGEYTSKKRIYLQAKNGNVDLYLKDYTELLKQNGDEVWLVTSGGKVYDSEKTAEQHQIVQYIKDTNSIKKQSYSLTILVDFIFDQTKQNILPEVLLTLIPLFE